MSINKTFTDSERSDNQEFFEDLAKSFRSNNVSPWKFGWIWQYPNRGTKKTDRNFLIGLSVYRHPRFTNYIFGLLFFEFGFGWSRKYITAQHEEKSKIAV